MRIEIVKHAECGPSVSHIESVGILKNAGEIVLLEVNLRTKTSSLTLMAVGRYLSVVRRSSYTVCRQRQRVGFGTVLPKLPDTP